MMLSACQSTGGSISNTQRSSALVGTDKTYPRSRVSANRFPRTDTSLELQDQAVQAPADLWERIREDLTWQAIDKPQIDPIRDQFLSQPSYLPVVSERGSLYLYYIVEEVQKRNMPMEIALVPLVESTLNPFAYSTGRAAGLWQIMPATGEDLGLQQDWWFDGRRSVRDSTRVALDYLEALHTQFDGDWLLALAAYNGGNGRVARAIAYNHEKGRPTDFWSLELPRETRRYVPKILALTQIIADPEAHAVAIPPLPNEPAFEVAMTGGQIEFTRAAELADISVTTLRELNPGQLRWATSPDRPQELLVPAGSGARFEEEISQLSSAERVRWRHYTIKPGDNLVGIAKQFQTEVSLLRRVNNINGSFIRAGKTLMIPNSNWAAGGVFSDTGDIPALGYKVRRGDSLYRIAGKYRVTVDEIVAWNSLDPQKFLQPGQTIKLHVSGI